MINTKVLEQKIEKEIQFLNTLSDPKLQLGAVSLLKWQISSFSKEYPYLNDKLLERLNQIEIQLKEKINQIDQALRGSMIAVLKSRNSNVGKDFSSVSTEMLISEVLSDFESLKGFGEIRKNVLNSVERVVGKMATAKTARELINFVIDEIKIIAPSSNRLLLYEPKTLPDGQKVLDATYAWGASTNSQLTSFLTNQKQQIKLWLGHLLELLPFSVCPDEDGKYLSAASQIWTENMQPILIDEISPVKLIERFSIPVDWKGKDVDLITIINSSYELDEKTLSKLKTVSVIDVKQYENWKEELRFKKIYELKEQAFQFYDSKGRPIRISSAEGVLVKRGDRYVYSELKFEKDYKIYSLGKDQYRWDLRKSNTVVLNEPMTKVADVTSMVLFPMSNLGVLFISDVGMKFVREGQVSKEGRNYLEAIRILTNILNQAILPLKQKELIEKYQEHLYRSHVAHYGKETADQMLALTETAEVIVIPFHPEETIVRFVDLRNSTAFGEFLDPEHYGELIDTFHDAFAPVSLKYNGRIISTPGDGNFHAFSSEREAVAASIVSFRELAKKSEDFNQYLFRDYVKSSLVRVNYPYNGRVAKNSLSKDSLKLIKHQFIEDLLKRIESKYKYLHVPEIELKELRKMFRHAIYEKIIKLNKKNDLLKDMFSFYPDIQEFSQTLYELQNGNFSESEVSKIGSLFNFRFSVGVGLNSGTVVSGSIGKHSGVIDITMLGDTVNSGSRIESANKEFGTEILASEIFIRNLTGHSEIADFGEFQLEGTAVHYKKIGSTKVKGKREEITLYSISF